MLRSHRPFSSVLLSLLAVIALSALSGCEATGSGPGSEVQEDVVPRDALSVAEQGVPPADLIEDEDAFARIFVLEGLARELGGAVEGGFDTTGALNRKVEEVVREIKWRRAGVSAQDLDQARLLRLERLKRVEVLEEQPRPSR